MKSIPFKNRVLTISSTFPRSIPVLTDNSAIVAAGKAASMPSWLATCGRVSALGQD
jgi:hypothetical protein